MSRFREAIGMFLTLAVTAYAENLDRSVIARPVDGDRRFDYVAKQPYKSTDPWNKV